MKSFLSWEEAGDLNPKFVVVLLSLDSFSALFQENHAGWYFHN